MKAAIAFCFENRLYYGTLEENRKLTIGSGVYDTMRVPGLPDSQFTLALNNQGLFFSGKAPYYKNNYPLKLEQVIPLNQKHRMYLYATALVGESSRRTKLPYNGTVTLGRSDSNMITVGLGFISRQHMQFVCREGIVSVRDCGSSNGLYVNGECVKQRQLKAGDVVSVYSFRITYISNELRFENCKGYIKIGVIPGLEKDSYTEQMETGIKFRRSPRIQSQLPTEPIVLSAPPNRGPQYQEKRNNFMNLVGTGTMFATSMLMGAASPVFMLARAAGLIMPISNYVNQNKNDKRRKEQLEEYERLRKELYGQYIEDQKQRIKQVAVYQREILQQENPSTEQCLSMVESRARNLWERTGRDRDFLDIRLGMGYDELCVPVKCNVSENAFQMEQDEMRHLAREIIEETKFVDNIPTRLHLKKYTAVGMLGNREKVVQEVRNMLISLCSTHFYEDVKIVGIFDESEKQLWEPLKWVPHTWDNDKQSRFLAFNRKEADVLCERMNDILEYRRRNLSDASYRDVQSPLPHYVFVIGSKRYVKDRILMQNLLLSRQEMGVSSIFLFDDMYELPKECEYILDMNGESVLGQNKNYPCGYERSKYNERYMFETDSGVSLQSFDQFARRMSAIQVEGFAQQSDVPDSITFLEGYGVKTYRQLEVEKRWSKPKSDESLPAPIGMMAGGRIFYLDAYQKGHGPHGLVAGTTGSGKSELVQTWILSLAVNYHPHDVAFVLIDYKGGGMAGHFRKLPHVIGEINNIAEGIERAFICLERENPRRQEIFDRYGVDDIKKYHKLYRNGEASEILPHLFIVVDEFAMLKKEKPDSISRLIKIATVGRSLGIHLLLATQNPSGVVDDQIQKNTNFRLCLKVQSGSDSREVIGTADAANIRSAGRAYVKVGNGELYEMFQSFWSGAPYYGENSAQQNQVNRVRVVATDGTRIRTASNQYTRLQSETDELREIVNHLAEVAAKMQIEKVDSLWLPELSNNIPLETLERKCGYDGDSWRGTEKWLHIPIGMYDSPMNQTQGVQYIDFNRDGHLGIYGAPRTGKTNLLKTILYSAGLNFTPEDVQIYGIDCGGGSTTVFEMMPHVGGIARDSELEKVQKLEKLLRTELNDRKRRFLQKRVNSLEDYRIAVGKDVPAILFVIDNMQALVELYPDMEDLLVSLGREGSGYGIYLVYTANGSTSVRFKIQQNITNAIAFELNDRGDYPGLVGRLQGQSLPSIKGRAFVKGEPPLVIQAASYMDGTTELERQEKLQYTLEQMDKVWTGKRPIEIPVMPDAVTAKDMLRVYQERARIPVGMEYGNITPAYMDLSGENYIMTVSGTIRSGKSRFLGTIIEMMKEKDEGAEIYIFDSKGTRAGLASYAKFAAAYGTADDYEQMTDMIDHIIQMLNTRARARKAEGEAFATSLPLTCIFIDDLLELLTGKGMDDENTDNMERICVKAAGLGVMIFVGGRPADLEKYKDNGEPLTNAIIRNQKALVLSGAPMLYTFLQNNLSNIEKSVELQEGEAYLYDNGSCIKMKPISC